MTASARPWIRVDTDMVDNAKIVTLSSDTVRWAVVCAWSKGKLRRPQGRWRNRALLEHDLGAYRLAADELIEAGVLEVAPSICRRCRTGYGRLKAGEVVAHDLGLHQPLSTERVKEWRARNGGLNGHQVLGGNGFPAVPPDVSQGLPSRALSQSPSLVDTTDESHPNDVPGGGGSGEEDPLDVAVSWLAARGLAAPAGSKVHTMLAQIVDRHGVQAVLETMAVLPKPLDDAAQAVYGARNALQPIPSGRDLAGVRKNREAAEADERHRKGTEATVRRAEELRATPAPGKSFGELMADVDLGSRS